MGYWTWQIQKLQLCRDKWKKNNLIVAAGDGAKIVEEAGFTANSEEACNWTAWHYVWMRLVFLLIAGKLFRGMLGLFVRIPLAWGSPPPLMMNWVGRAASLYSFSNLTDSSAASIIASIGLQDAAWLKFVLGSPFARFWQNRRHCLIRCFSFLFVPSKNCFSNHCAWRHSPKYHTEHC